MPDRAATPSGWVDSTSTPCSRDPRPNDVRTCGVTGIRTASSARDTNGAGIAEAACAGAGSATAVSATAEHSSPSAAKWGRNRPAKSLIWISPEAGPQSEIITGGHGGERQGFPAGGEPEYRLARPSASLFAAVA